LTAVVLDFNSVVGNPNDKRNGTFDIHLPDNNTHSWNTQQQELPHDGYSNQNHNYRTNVTMNWLSKLDELVTNLLPEEDRNYAKRNGGNGILHIDPLLDMELNYGAEVNDNEESEESCLHESNNNNNNRDRTQTSENTQPLTEDMFGELDQFMEGSSSLSQSLPRNDTASTTLEAIAPENSMLNSSDSSFNRSEQPTGDVTIESRHQRDGQLEQPQSWSAVVVLARGA
jgi:hypothetical protein